MTIWNAQTLLALKVGALVAASASNVRVRHETEVVNDAGTLFSIHAPIHPHLSVAASTHGSWGGTGDVDGADAPLGSAPPTANARVGDENEIVDNASHQFMPCPYSRSSSYSSLSLRL